MKHTFFTHLLPVALAATLAVSCEDHRNDYMEEYQTMAYFRNGGEQQLALYRTGEDGIYAIPVVKAGRNLSGTISVELLPMDQDQITLYNAVNFTNYTAIPSYLYDFLDEKEQELDVYPVTLNFASDEKSKIVKVRLKTNRIRALMDAHPDKSYVLGLQLFSAKGKVSDKINVILLTPEIAIPYLSFSNNGVFSFTYNKNSQQEFTYTNRVKFAIDENRWDFTCNLEVKDATWVSRYNAAHGTDYELLPAANYTVPNSLHFPVGTTEVPFDVKISRSGMTALHNYVLPVAVKDATRAEFVPYETDEANDYVYMVQVLMIPDQLTIGTEQMSALYDGQAGFPASNLIDGDPDTFWRSPGSSAYGGFAGDPQWGFWFDIDLENHPLDAFVLGYLPSSTTNRAPTRILLGVSNDGVNFTQVADVHDEAMHFRANWYDLPLVKTASPMRYIRVGVTETFINDTVYPLNAEPVNMTCEIAELRLYGSSN